MTACFPYRSFEIRVKGHPYWFTSRVHPFDFLNCGLKFKSNLPAAVSLAKLSRLQ
ncbi:MAG TPA: hypothetical protein VNN13_13915 [Methylomirabilota bacterium]|jgi:hypothetical protein|nr:hypothetical protein [Methylomirabilota bacterium]